MKQEKSLERDTATVTIRPNFTIRGAFCGDKCFPSLNDYLAEIGRNPKCGGKYKRQYIMIATNAIRRDLKRFKTDKPIILHYTFAEPYKGNKRDRGNIFSLADKFIEDALRDCKVIPDDVVARGVAIVIMGILIGIGVGLLEQFAKQAWLKVIRGEFEGKEYLVFAGTTSIGNNGKNTIVLFKDKLVGPHHCDITLDGSKYVLTDCGTPMGTIVNGQKVARHILRQGDAIAIGNSVLVFNTK